MNPSNDIPGGRYLHGILENDSGSILIAWRSQASLIHVSNQSCYLARTLYMTASPNVLLRKVQVLTDCAQSSMVLIIHIAS
jgi:hypothetical protein